MWDLQACLVCLNTDVKLYNLDTFQLRQAYNLVTGLKTLKGSGLPDYLCVECSAYVRRFKNFRSKCHRAFYTLQELLHRNKEITRSNLKSIDRALLSILPTLSYIDNTTTHYEKIKFQWTKRNRLGVSTGEVPVILHSTYDDAIKVPNKTNHINTQKNEFEVKIEDREPTTSRTIVQSEYQDVKNDYIQNSVDSDTHTNNIDTYVNNYEDVVENDDIELNDDGVIIVEKTKIEEANGTNLDEEYASMLPISYNEAKAAVEIFRTYSHGKYRCEVCNHGFQTDKRLQVHMRMHEMYISGTFLCEFCQYYYKTDFLLKTHLTEKHMYKFICKKCPEVSFDRISAKQHYIWTHLQKRSQDSNTWYDIRPSWLSTKGGKRVKGIVSIKPIRKVKKLPQDFLKYTPIEHNEQYTLISDRQKTRNYIESAFRCELCYRGFREVNTYEKHMKKHDPVVSGPMQCDICKLQFKNTRKMYKHMIITHLYKYSCQVCKYVCFSRGQAHMHYRWHKNVTYACPHCDSVFKKASTRLTHIRIKHPSSCICNLCGHSFVSEAGLYCHKKISHGPQEIEAADLLKPDPGDNLYCSDCNIQFINEAAYDTHLGSSNKHATINFSSKPVRMKSANRRGPKSQLTEGMKRRGRPRHGSSSEILNLGTITTTNCEVCGLTLANDVQARKHYEGEHPGHDYLKRYMCDVCGHITKLYANLLVHMRTHTREKPYECPHCDRRFSMTSNRDRHLVVHTGEKRYQCQHCNRRFTQSSAVKLHIQTVHLKIPYAPWDKKNRKRRKEQESISTPAPALSAMTTMAQQQTLMQPQHKLLLETQGEYLNAYITYSDE